MFPRLGSKQPRLMYTQSRKCFPMQILCFWMQTDQLDKNRNCVSGCTDQRDKNRNYGRWGVNILRNYTLADATGGPYQCYSVYDVQRVRAQPERNARERSRDQWRITKTLVTEVALRRVQFLNFSLQTIKLTIFVPGHITMTVSHCDLMTT
mmetsp:Transcript_36303/g.58123  ORF Transcript_36303/g.58123 Transcript_36303/m.58123 type:complete len:151 (+) Transcript_36303:452-904(+)